MIRFVIERPIAVSMLFLALVLIGAVSFTKLPVDLLPSITYPRLTVITTYEDVPAEDVERLVTRPIEEVVTALTGVRRVVSRTREGVSIITVEYEWGTQMDFANLHLREAVDRVAFRDDFPRAAQRPVILRWDPLSRPISILTLGGSDDLRSLTEFATEVVKPALQQVDGISQAEVVGGEEREILVEPDPAKLAMYAISMEDIRQALVRSNVSFPGGKIREGPLQLSLRITGEFESLQEVASTDVATSGGSPVRVGDIARVLDTTKEPEGVTLLGDTAVVSLLVYKEPEANTILASRGIDRTLKMLAEDYPDLNYSFVYRDAEYVRASFMGLVQSLLIGSLLAFLVLFLFLRDARSPLVVGISIPVSIFVTFALLYFGKVKLNLMSLGGLSLAAGMLVDNAIVVLENINRHIAEKTWSNDPSFVPSDDSRLTRGRALAVAATNGTGEVARAVFAATLTTVAVFFPVVYVPGIAGAFFRDQALTVTFSLLVSVASALLLQPMLSARVLAARESGPSGVFRLFHAAFEKFHEIYHSNLERALRRPLAMTLGLLVILGVAAPIGLHITRTFMPERSSGDFKIDIELPNGTPLEETVATTASLAGWLEEQPDVEKVFSQVGRTERTVASLREYTGPNSAHTRVIVTRGRGAHRRGSRLQKGVAAYLERLPGVAFAFREEGVGLEEVIGSGEESFSFGIVAENPAQAVRAAQDMVSRLSSHPELTNVQLDRVFGTPTLVVHLDSEEILRNGLAPDAVARELRARTAGIEATTFNEVDRRIDIAVRLDRTLRKRLDAALGSGVVKSKGRTIPIHSLVELEEDTPVRELTRRNQRPMITITCNLAGVSEEQAWRIVRESSAGLDLPPSVRLVESSEQQEMERSFKDLGWAMLLAAFLVYVILAAQFESFVDPLLISTVLPIGLAGSLITLAITRQSVNLLSMIGMVALLGIAVNDAIIKVDTIRRLREEGMDGYQAILEASRLRLRPIVMTSVTTILAMVPMAIGIGSGEQLQRPLALTIIGGLFLTTTLTLFYVPIFYKVVHRIKSNRP